MVDVLASETVRGTAADHAGDNQTPTSPQFVSVHLQSAYDRFHSQLATLPEEARILGTRLVAKLMPPQWSLEWYLPEWLADSTGIPEDQVETIVLANACGLCTIVLWDRMIDEGSDDALTDATVFLSGALEQWWLVTYARLLGSDAWFWQRYDDIMDQWRHATAISNRHPDVSFDAYLQNNWRELAQRAAPLKTCCAAVCQLARREDQFPLLDQLLDHMHIAKVLLDHANDWNEDSEAGRYNAFVHFVLRKTDGSVDAKAARRAVYHELWWGEQAVPYFALANEHLSAALAYAAQVSCPALGQIIEAESRQLNQFREAMVAAAQTWLRSATESLFGDSQA